MTVIELTEGWSKTTKAGAGKTAKRVFGYNGGAGNSTLPEVGVSLHPDDPDLIVESIEETKWAGHPDKKRYVVSYIQNNMSTAGIEQLPPDLLPRRLTISGEMQEVSDGMYWYNDGAEAQQSFFRRIIGGTWSVTEITRDRLAKIAKITALTGKVNNASQDGFEAGTMLYLGASMEEELDDEGRPFWRTDHQWAIRIVTFGAGDAGAPDQDGWNYDWREDLNEWHRVDVSAGMTGDGLYPTADMSAVYG